MSIFQEFQLKKRKRKFYHCFGEHFWYQNLDIEVKNSYYSKCLKTLWAFKRKINSSCQKFASSANNLRLAGKLSYCQKGQICPNLVSTEKVALNWVFIDQSILFLYTTQLNNITWHQRKDEKALSKIDDLNFIPIWKKIIRNLTNPIFLSIRIWSLFTKS